MEVAKTDGEETITDQLKESGENLEPQNSDEEENEIENVRFECYMCHVWFNTIQDISRHGIDVHNRHDVLKRGPPKNAEQ